MARRLTYYRQAPQTQRPSRGRDAMRGRSARGLRSGSRLRERRCCAVFRAVDLLDLAYQIGEHRIGAREPLEFEPEPPTTALARAEIERPATERHRAHEANRAATRSAEAVLRKRRKLLIWRTRIAAADGLGYVVRRPEAPARNVRPRGA